MCTPSVCVWVCSQRSSFAAMAVIVDSTSEHAGKQQRDINRLITPEVKRQMVRVCVAFVCVCVCVCARVCVCVRAWVCIRTYNCPQLTVTPSTLVQQRKRVCICTLVQQCKQSLLCSHANTHSSLWTGYGPADSRIACSSMQLMGNFKHPCTPHPPTSQPYCRCPLTTLATRSAAQAVVTGGRPSWRTMCTCTGCRCSGRPSNPSQR